MAGSRALLVGSALVLAGFTAAEQPPSCSAAAPTCGTAQGPSLVQRRRELSQALVIPEVHDGHPVDVPDEITFTAVVRDFKADHPDFQTFDGHFTGLVEDRLGADGKPVFKGGAVLSSQANFDQWYHDTPGVNKRIEVPLTLVRTSHNTYAIDNPSFFPIDGRGWNDTAVALDGNPHNFYFTLELASTFIYQGGERFTFRGDDDVWVFINNQLVIDLGGVHNPLEGAVDLDTLGLRPGSTVDFSFFFAERRCCGSNFRLETSIQFTPIWGNCVLWGDPHVSVFDRGVAQGKGLAPIMGMFSTGDFWLVRSSLMSIQGRYGQTPWTTPGQSALIAIAVGGLFLQNHTLIIEPMNDGGKVTWDGKKILQQKPSEWFIKGFVNISFHGDDRRRLIDKAQANFPLNIITAHMPENTYMTVNRWAKHLDAIIAMSQQPGGQDGHCGNFNGDPLDDTKELIQQRVSAVAAEDLLFTSPTPRGAGTELTLEDCKVKKRQEAEHLCKESDPEATKDMLDACVFDVCFGGKQYAVEDGVVDREAGSQQA